MILQPHFNPTYVIFGVLVAVNRNSMTRDAIYFPPDLRHLPHHSVSHRTRPQIYPFYYSFLFTIKINYGSTTILTRRREKEDFFGMILYIHFLCLYRWKFLIHTGGEQINCTVQLRFDGYTCYSRKPITSY